jgi:hypothetical protein
MRNSASVSVADCFGGTASFLHPNRRLGSQKVTNHLVARCGD